MDEYGIDLAYSRPLSTWGDFTVEVDVQYNAYDQEWNEFNGTHSLEEDENLSDSD